MDFKDKIFNMDCLEGLKTLPDNSIDCCITSPPYFGLRDYGNENQIGLEETPEEFVNKLVEVFAEVKRVLKPEGTLWLNLGDSYYRSGNDQPEQKGMLNTEKINQRYGFRNENKLKSQDLKPKDLIGIPWMVAFALRTNGWYLRQDIIWHKPNPMPESVTDRCTKAHEYIFLLSKSPKYYFDNEKISENANYAGEKRGKSRNISPTRITEMDNKIYNTRNKRSVWTVTTKPFSEAHFATFPEDLIVDCIKAGCPEGGLVLDPFMGAGTTGLVAKKLNRHYVGFELNPEYIKIAERRIYTEIGLFL